MYNFIYDPTNLGEAMDNLHHAIDALYEVHKEIDRLTNQYEKACDDLYFAWRVQERYEKVAETARKLWEDLPENEQNRVLAIQLENALAELDGQGETK